MSRVCRLSLVFLALAACGDNGGGNSPDGGGDDDGSAIDAPTDAPPPPDPFAGMFDSPDDFPRTNCRAGALTGFATVGVWTDLGLRTAIEGGALATYVPKDQLDEQLHEHMLTADDLLVRTSSFNFNNNRWSLRSIDVCDVLPDGTLIGTSITCLENSSGPRCFNPYEFSTPPLHRIAGEGEGQNLTKLGELGLEGHPVNVRVAGGYAFLPMLDMGMRIVSVANPAAPVKVSWWFPAESNWYNDVKLMETGGRRYAVLAGRTIDVIDVTDPATPFLASQIPASAHTLDVEGTMVYLAGGGAFLSIYDLSTPTAPIKRADFDSDEVPFGSHDLHVKDGIAYVSAPDVGLGVIDCRTPTAPVSIGVALEDEFRYWHSPWLTQIGGKPFVIHGDEANPGKLAVIDLDPASPTYLQEVGVWEPRPEVSLHNITARGNRAYFAHYQDGIRVLDLTDPTHPTPMAYFNTWSEDRAVAAYFTGAFGLDLDPATRRIYVADSIRGLLILEGTPALFP